MGFPGCRQFGYGLLEGRPTWPEHRGVLFEPGLHRAEKLCWHVARHEHSICASLIPGGSAYRRGSYVVGISDVLFHSKDA